MLFSEGKDLPANLAVERAAKTELQDQSTNRIDFYAEHLDASRFPGESYYRLFRDYLREKYTQQPPDLVMAFLARGFGLAGQLPEEVFPAVPVVFVSVNELGTPNQFRLAHTTGIVQRHDFQGTFDLILQLQPGTRRVVVIGGIAPIDQVFIGRAQEVARSFAGRTQFEFWTNRPVAALPSAVAQLPPHTVVCLSTVLRDAAGQNFFPEQVTARLAASANVPVYVLSATLLGDGAVGGALVDFEALGRRAGQLALQILNGMPPASLPIEVRTHGTPMFDWRALKRWNISENRLPDHSVLRYRPPSVWEDHKGLILAALAVILGQMVTIAALLVHRARRRRSEAALRDSEERLTLATTSAKVGVWSWDIEAGTIEATAECKKIFGLEPGHVVNFEMFEALVHPEDRLAVRQAIQEAIERQTIYDKQYRIVRADGQTCWIAARGRCRYDNGKALGMMGVLVDISERKTAEEAVAQHKAELAHLARVNTLNELSGSLAHELNQPLGIILSNAQAATRLLDHQPPNLAEVRDILADIVAADRRAGEVIRRLRALLKRGETRFQPLSFNEIIREVLHLLNADLIGRGIVVVQNLAPDLPQVSGDRVQLQQLLLNLLVNAADALSANPPGLRRVHLDTTLQSNTVRVSVRDQGVGLPTETEHLFQPFYTTKPHGLGMGLAICRSIASAHHGKLWAAAHPERGAVFHLELPIAGEAKSDH